MSSGFRISHPKVTLEITLEEVEKLHVHEETIPEVLDKLTEKIKVDRIFIHPIIADEKTLVVLDGMHRVAAAKSIGYNLVPVCLVDYTNPNIVVGSWYRLIDEVTELEKIREAIIDLDLTVADDSFEEAHRKVEERKAVAAVFSQSECLTFYGNSKNINQIYDDIKKIELKLRSSGYPVSYCTEKDAVENVGSSNVSAALITPTVSKNEIINMALAGRVFMQKTTRHIIPARPMFINVPNKWLYRAATELSNKRKRLAKLLSSRKLERLPSGQVMDRRYEEELYIFGEEEPLG